MSNDNTKIYFYNNTYYTEDDLKNLPRHTRFVIRHHENHLNRVKINYNNNTDVKKQYGRDYYYYRIETNRLRSIEW